MDQDIEIMWSVTQWYFAGEEEPSPVIRNACINDGYRPSPTDYSRIQEYVLGQLCEYIFLGSPHGMSCDRKCVKLTITALNIRNENIYTEGCFSDALLGRVVTTYLCLIHSACFIRDHNFNIPDTWWKKDYYAVSNVTKEVSKSEYDVDRKLCSTTLLQYAALYWKFTR